jgi:hypothetical protein
MKEYIRKLEDLPEQHEEPAKEDIYESLTSYMAQASKDWRNSKDIKLSEYDSDSRRMDEEKWARLLIDKLQKSNSLQAFSGKIRQIYETPGAPRSDYMEPRHRFPYRRKPEGEGTIREEVFEEAGLESLWEEENKDWSESSSDIFEESGLAELNIDEFKTRNDENFETVLAYAVVPVVDRYTE